MQKNFTFVPKDCPLTVFESILIGRVHLDQYQVHLQGYRNYGGWTQLDVPRNPHLTAHLNLPELVVESWADWKSLLASTPGEINFGTGFEDNVLPLEGFIQMVEDRASPKTLGRNGVPLSSPYEYLHNSGKATHKLMTEDPDANWKDEEGYSFTTLLYV